MEMVYRNGAAISPEQSLVAGEAALTLGCWILIYGAVIQYPWPTIKKKKPKTLTLNVVKISSGYVSCCFGFELFLVTSKYPKQPNFPKISLV